MSKPQPLSLLLPVGRIVQGSLYKAQDKDIDGKPRVYPPNHPKAGQPKISYFFALAIPKNPGETHWASSAWGQQIWNFGHGAWPQLIDPATRYLPPSFAWKIEDGDDSRPNLKAKGRRNCDREGFPGHWIVNLNSTFPPKIYTRDGAGRVAELPQVDAVKPGYYVEVQATIDSNESQQSPGLYVNHSMVMLRGYGAEIRQGVDPNSIPWGQSALPAGASTTPVGGTPVATAPGAMPGGPGAPGAPSPGGTGYPPPVPAGAPPAPAPAGYAPPPAAAPPAAAPAPTPVVPSPTFLNPPPAAGAPPPPAAPGVPPAGPPAPQMTAKAAGQTYDAFIKAGWNDAQLRAHGYMI